MSKKNKKIKEQQLLAHLEREEVLNKALTFSKKRFKRFHEIIDQVYRKEELNLVVYDPRILKIKLCFTKQLGMGGHKVLRDVFIHLERNSELVSDEEHIQAVLNMVRYRAYWRSDRDIFQWLPRSKRAPQQMIELASYLFCIYKVPEFLYKAFLEADNMKFIEWFIHIGVGKSVRTLNLPIPFTQKMAYYFLQASSTLHVVEALRWAQAKGMGADDKLADRIVSSWIGTKPHEDEEFWETFIRTAINAGMFNYDKLTELIDYVREMRRESSGYSLKGRTVQSLMRQSEEWHKIKLFVRGSTAWDPSGLYGYKIVKKEEEVRMEELTGSKLLSEEGRKMKHCVATYTHQCKAGKTAIFSLRKYCMGLLTETLATIEVNLQLRRVVQAKGKMNRKISTETKRHLDQWARKNALSVSDFL